MFLFCHFSLCEIIGEDCGGKRGGEYVLYELESYPQIGEYCVTS